MLDFATLKILTNQSSHVTKLRLSDWSKFSVEYFMLDFWFIGSGPGYNRSGGSNLFTQL